MYQRNNRKIRFVSDGAKTCFSSRFGCFESKLVSKDSLFQPNLRTFRFHSSIRIVELREAVTLSQIFSQLGFKRGAAKLRWAVGVSLRDNLRVNEPKRSGPRSAWARSAAKTHLFLYINTLLVMGLLERSSPTVSSPDYLVSLVSDNFFEQMT